MTRDRAVQEVGSAPGDAPAPEGGRDLRMLALHKRARARRAQKEEAATPEKKMAALQASIGRLESGAVPAWQRAVDGLDANAVRSAGGQALEAWAEASALAEALEGSEEAGLAENALLMAKLAVGKLGLHAFHGKPIDVPEIAPVGDDPTAFIQHAIERTVLTVEHLRKVIDLCAGAAEKSQGRGPTLEPDQQHQILALLGEHRDYAEMTFLFSALNAYGFWHLIDTEMSGFMEGSELREMEHTREEEATLSDHGKEQVPPAMKARIDDDAERIDQLIEDDGDAEDYVAILETYQPWEREKLLDLLDDREQIDNMVHRGGGDEVTRLIREVPGYFSHYVYNDDRVTERSRTERLEHALGTAVRLLPGAPLSLLGGFLHGLSDVPLVGGLAKRAGDGVQKEALSVDESLGVDHDLAKLSDEIAGGAGTVDAKIFETEVAGKVEGAEAAKDVSDVASAGEEIAGMVGTVRDSMRDLDEVWSLGSTIASGAITATTDAISGLAFDSPDAVQRSLDDIGGVIDAGITALGGTVEGAVTEKGKKEKAEKAEDKERDRELKETPNQNALTVEGRIHSATMVRATRDALHADTPEKAALAIQHASEAHDAAMAARQENPMLDRAVVTAQMKKDDPPKDDEKGYLRNLGHRLVEQIKQAIIDAVVSALKKLREELFTQIAAWAGDPEKTPREKKRLVVELATAAVTSGLTEGVVGLVENQAKALVEDAVRYFAEQRFPGLGDGITALADGPIGALLDYIKDKTNVEEHLQGLFEPMVERVLGGDESESVR